MTDAPLHRATDREFRLRYSGQVLDVNRHAIDALRDRSTSRD